MKYRVNPEVPGNAFGKNSVYERDPAGWPVFKKLHYVFDGWLGDVLITNIFIYLVTPEVRRRFVAAGITGARYDDAEVSASETYIQVKGHDRVPEFVWMIPAGGEDDDVAMIENGSQLVLSKRAVDILRPLGIGHAQLTPILAEGEFESNNPFTAVNLEEGSPADPDSVAELQEILDFEMPEAWRRFVAEQDGAEPHSNHVGDPELDRVVMGFIPVAEIADTVREVYGLEPSETSVIPFADDMNGIFVFSREDQAVYFQALDYQVDGLPKIGTLSKIASSFPEFVAMMTTVVEEMERTPENLALFESPVLAEELARMGRRLKKL